MDREQVTRNTLATVAADNAGRFYCYWPKNIHSYRIRSDINYSIMVALHLSLTKDQDKLNRWMQS